MKNAEYWKKRMEFLENRSNEEGKKTYKRVEDAFLRAEREITEKTEAWYGRFAKNNNVTLQEAKKLLNSNELKEFKWDVWKYIKKGEESNLNGKWIKELENASSKFHITRLDALKLQMQQYLEIAFGNELDEIDRMARKVMTENYYHTCFEVQKGLNIGWDIGLIDERKLEKYISMPWASDGKVFSERVWANRAKLVNELHTELTRNCILGMGCMDLVNKMSEKMRVSKSRASALVMTEQAYFHSISQKEAFNELDVEEYEIVATLDSRTTPICRHMDGKHFPMKDFKVGVTAPIFHVRCRSVIAPYFDDDLTIGQRAARGEDGKTYYVLGDMTYKEWERKFVKKDLKEFGTVLDITSTWIALSNKLGTLTYRRNYNIDGIEYRVDENHNYVELKPSKTEIKIAELMKSVGKHIEIIPKINYPQGLKTPDYLIDGVRFDLKSPTGKGKNLLYGLIKANKKQSNCFIINVEKCPLSFDDLEKQALGLFRSQRTAFLDTIVFTNETKVLKVLKRK